MIQVRRDKYDRRFSFPTKNTAVSTELKKLLTFLLEKMCDTMIQKSSAQLIMSHEAAFRALLSMDCGDQYNLKKRQLCIPLICYLQQCSEFLGPIFLLETINVPFEK